MLLVKNIDNRCSRVISTIPEKLKEPLRWLGRLSTPLLWTAYIALIQVFLYGKIDGPALVVICLMPVASLIKLFFRRKRPPTIFTENMRIKSYSFPSSHAYSAALAGGYLSIVAIENSHILVSVAISFLILLIGVSRVRIGAHYPSDVIAGWILGLSLLTLAL